MSLRQRINIHLLSTVFFAQISIVNSRAHLIIHTKGTPGSVLTFSLALAWPACWLFRLPFALSKMYPPTPAGIRKKKKSVFSDFS